MKRLIHILCSTIALLLLSVSTLAEEGLKVYMKNYEVNSDSAIVELVPQLMLDQSLVEALVSGTEIGFNLELVINRQGWITDKELKSYSWKGSLRRPAYGLGFEYRSFNDTEWKDADNIEVVFASMNTFRIEITDPELLKELRSFDVYLEYRVEIDLELLPNPLRVELLTSSNWSFSSGWQKTQKPQ